MFAVVMIEMSNTTPGANTMRITSTTPDNTIGSIVQRLLVLMADHGDLPCFLDDMQPLVDFEVHVGETNYERGECPKGYVVLGPWA